MTLRIPFYVQTDFLKTRFAQSAFATLLAGLCHIREIADRMTTLKSSIKLESSGRHVRPFSNAAAGPE